MALVETITIGLPIAIMQTACMHDLTSRAVSLLPFC